MRKRLFVPLIVFILILSTGCFGGLTNSFFTISISGADGVTFSGYYKVTKNTGETVVEEISGSVPLEVDVKGYYVFCRIKKEGGKGVLKLELLKFGNNISSTETTHTGEFISVYSR